VAKERRSNGKEFHAGPSTENKLDEIRYLGVYMTAFEDHTICSHAKRPFNNL